ncbi:hypothetical protein GCM10009827_119450 [Dactylosporangium maewongense]|uniref:Uncharacterized protein n=2 Tax=Dactylosporangium maewongense TaxID=634393 RepID=A0ABP4PFW6_9ACTN
MVVILTTRQWIDLVRACGLSRVIDALQSALTVDFADESMRYKFRDILSGLVQRWFDRNSAADVEHVLGGTRVLWSRFRTFREVVTQADEGDPSSILTRLDQPGIGQHMAPGAPLVFAGQRQGPLPAPTPAGDTAEILREVLQHDAESIGRLTAAGVVGRSEQT